MQTTFKQIRVETVIIILNIRCQISLCCINVFIFTCGGVVSSRTELKEDCSALPNLTVFASGKAQ